MVGIDSDVQWGKASTELVKLIYDPAVIGLLAVGREPAHLAEQLAVKTFVPVLAVSSDRSLTSTNVAWIFRVGPDVAVEEGCPLHWPWQPLRPGRIVCAFAICSLRGSRLQGDTNSRRTVS
ncbi:MAG: hypothetical protein WDO73_01440 [Ignavibacteriota bacterium]